VRAGLAAIGRAQYSRLQEGKTRGGSHLEGDWRVARVARGRLPVGTGARHIWQQDPPRSAETVLHGSTGWPSRRTAPGGLHQAEAGAVERTEAGAQRAGNLGRAARCLHKLWVPAVFRPVLARRSPA
jgi:hypothetical protein